jgi:hypothetical protein
MDSGFFLLNGLLLTIIALLMITELEDDNDE